MIAASAGRRTCQPVRRNSYDVDDARAKVFRPIEGGMRFVNAYVDVFEEWADLAKKPGRPDRYGLSCRKVLRVLLAKFTDFATGICEPCIDTIMKKAQLARATVARALALLDDAGCTDWVRRTVRTDNAPGEGPQVRQVSNAYFFDLTRLPKRALARLQQKLRKSNVTVRPDREPRRPIFAGFADRRSQKIRKARAAIAGALANASSDRERAAILYPGDEAAQHAYLAMIEGASSAASLNPIPSIEVEAE